MIKSGCEPTLNSLFGEMAGDKMSKREQYEARTEELLLPILNENNFELVDVEYVKERQQLVSARIYRQRRRYYGKRL